MQTETLTVKATPLPGGMVKAKHADESILDTPEEWLDGFGMFSIYQALPKLIELWWVIYRHSGLCSGRCRAARFPYGRRAGLFR